MFVYVINYIRSFVYPRDFFDFYKNFNSYLISDNRDIREELKVLSNYTEDSTFLTTKTLKDLKCVKRFWKGSPEKKSDCIYKDTGFFAKLDILEDFHVKGKNIKEVIIFGGVDILHLNQNFLEHLNFKIQK